MSSNGENSNALIAFTYLLASELNLPEINLATKDFERNYKNIYSKLWMRKSKELTDIFEEANDKISDLEKSHKREMNINEEIKELKKDIEHPNSDDTIEINSSLIENKREELDNKQKVKDKISTEYNDKLNSFIEWYVSAAKKLNIDKKLDGLACYINRIEFLGTNDETY
ncbi:MAG: hypothetical protein MHPSP_000135 [Paramarteilia canceri]